MFHSKFGDDVDREHSKKSEKSESEDATGNSDGRKQEMNEERENDMTSDDICDKTEKDSPFSDENPCRTFFAELDEITKKCKVPVENRQWGYLFSDSEEDEATEELSENEDEYGEITGDDKETTDSEFYDTDLDDPPPKTSTEGKKVVYNENTLPLEHHTNALYGTERLILYVRKIHKFSLFIPSIKKWI